MENLNKYKDLINSYWVLNLWEAVDGETVEINDDPQHYIDLDISIDFDQNIIVEKLLKPQLNFFNKDNQEKIQKGLLFTIKNLSENELLKNLNFLGGSIFATPNPKISCKKFHEKIYSKLFAVEDNLDLRKVYDIKDKNDYRNFEI